MQVNTKKNLVSGNTEGAEGPSAHLSRNSANSVSLKRVRNTRVSFEKVSVYSQLSLCAVALLQLKLKEQKVSIIWDL